MGSNLVPIKKSSNIVFMEIGDNLFVKVLYLGYGH